MIIKINLKLLNLFVFSAWVIVFFISLMIDIPNRLSDNNLENFRLLYLNPITPVMLFDILLAGFAGGAFFVMAYLYNGIRKTKVNKYLSSLIFYMMLYQGISRFVEVFFVLSASSLYGLVAVAGRYFYPLEILSTVIFSIVAFDVFLFPAMETSKEGRRSLWMIAVGISGAIIGMIALFFTYITLFFTYIISISIRMTVVFIGLGIFGVIITVVVFACFKIFRLSRTVSEPRNKFALQVLGIQLLISLIVIILFIFAEVGDFLEFSIDTIYLLRTIKNGLYLVMAILYLYSFIRPGLAKKIETPA